MSKSLKVVFTNTTIGEVVIDKKQVQKYLQAVSWQSMVPEEIAFILMKNPAPWRPKDNYIPKSSLNLPLLVMPMIYFTRFESSSMAGNKLILRFFGPSIGGWHLYMKNPEMYAWDNTRQVIIYNRIQELSPDIVNKIPASENFTAIEWLDRFVNDVPMPYQEMTTERLEALWDIVMWKNYHNYTTRVNDRISTTLSKFYGFEDLGGDELQNNMQANFRNFWARFNAKVRKNRYYSMGIMTIPLKRATHKRKRDGRKTLPSLPIVPVEVRKLIDSYIFS